MTSKKYFSKKQAYARYAFALGVLIFGIILNYLNIGENFLGFSSVGNWLIFVGFIMIAVITLTFLKNQKRIIDERMEKIAYQASRITFLFIILGAFVVMVWDGIQPIQIPYSTFMSQMVAWIMIVYIASYKILDKYYY